MTHANIIILLQYDNEIRVKMKEFANVVSDLRRTHIKNSQSFYL